MHDHSRQEWLRRRAQDSISLEARRQPPEPKWAAPPMPAAAKPAEAKQPTQAELDAYLNTMKDKVRGAIVFVGKHVEVPEDMNPAPHAAA